MNIVNPLRTSGNAANGVCACVCDNGSAYWNASGETYSTHCGCQCIEGNYDNARANFNLATSKAR